MKIYNTLSRKKEEFTPRENGKVSIYVCGPTVYNYIHVGNARTFLNFDMIRRYLRHSGYEVTFVQNITDVDDKIINRASEEGTSPEEVAAKYTWAFEKDMESLGVEPPDIAPRATEHIEDMISVIEGLIEKKHAYASAGDVYFDVSTFPRYGMLSGRDLDDQIDSSWTEGKDKKRAPHDFALWKAAKPGEPCWKSPWGDGRPGWHIECSTMSLEYLGSGFDIHGGGQDLIFPHHENEIAQAEALTGEKFARYWVHSGMLTIDEEKMSKSLGNITLLSEALIHHSPETIRMLCLLVHYRSPLNFSEESLAEANASCERIRRCLFNLKDLLERLEGEKMNLERTERENKLLFLLEDSQSDFRNAMDDDFNTAAALSGIFGLVREINAYVQEVSSYKTPAARLMLSECEGRLEEMLDVLGLSGLSKATPQQYQASARVRIQEPIDSDELIKILLDARELSRETGEYEIADMIRKRLMNLGIKVEDLRGRGGRGQVLQ
ncbi:MAG: cysteine--tRNA ligase [Actinomycetota bacterium]|nr:cysteine--tRNA ligase [Actinomycetota bacterium]